MWPLLLLAAFALAGRRRPRIAPAGWVWPLPVLDEDEARDAGVHAIPDISSGWGEPRADGSRKHLGVDVMYKRLGPLASVRAGTVAPDGGSRAYYVPPDISAVAAHRGRIWRAGWYGGGGFVMLDHGPLLMATFYTHLSELHVPEVPTTMNARNALVVEAGTPLGLVGASPRGPNPRHLHFELRVGKDAVNPEPYMQQWTMVRT